jgi:hypothetical protein
MAASAALGAPKPDYMNTQEGMSPHLNIQSPPKTMKAMRISRDISPHKPTARSDVQTLTFPQRSREKRL